MTTSHFQSHYIPNTETEQAEMLATLGLTAIDDLFHDIPDAFRNPPLELPQPLSELEIQRELGAMAASNRSLGSGPSFLGAGAYHHFIPSIVKALMTRGEFLTAYTPYQPEVSQGTLQVIYEFQTLISNLYGMGRGQCRHVRRRHQPGRGRADGLPGHPALPRRRVRHRLAYLSASPSAPTARPRGSKSR